MPDGMITKGVGGLYTVITEKCEYFCKARGLFRKNDEKPIPGDFVIFEVTNEQLKEGYLLKIKKRKNFFIRPAVANIDQAILVVSVIDPKPDLLLIDKLICVCESKNITPIICVNKIDLGSKSDEDEITNQYKKTGYEIISCSVKTEKGISLIEDLLHEKISVFAGQSGVGKSSILNSIMKQEVMEIGDISAKIGRGKHTTRHAEFINIHGGYLVDTPGFSNFEPQLFSPNMLKELYVEFNEYENTCRFSGCIHINEPDCTVKNAVKSGKISIERHNRYKIIYELIKQAEKDQRGY